MGEQSDMVRFHQLWAEIFMFWFLVLIPSSQKRHLGWRVEYHKLGAHPGREVVEGVMFHRWPVSSSKISLTVGQGIQGTAFQVDRVGLGF